MTNTLQPENINTLRFWVKVDNSKGEDACWLWTAGVNDAGYGQFQVGKRPHLSHRVSWVLTFGPMPEGACVLHKCDNPLCVNPLHLFLGTKRDNNRDRHQKGRDAKGEKHGSKTHPERVPRGDNHPSRLMPERWTRGDAHWTRLYPDRVPRGDQSNARLHREKMARGDRHGTATKPESIRRGEDNGSSKLTADQVIAVRASTDTRSDIAKQFGITKGTVTDIKKRHSWKHIK